jgi:hypothetical protein
MRALLLVGAAASLAACASAPPPPPATLTFADRTCADQPDLTTAISLTPPKERPVFLVNAPVTGETPCIKTVRGPSPVVVFALPTDYDDKTIIVGGVLEPLRILSPHVAVLDRDGAVTRTFPADEFLYRGSVYSVQFRPRENEAYLRVSVEPERVGQNYDSIKIGVNYNAITVGYVTSVVGTGVESRTSRAFSYEGSIQVMVNDTDTKEDKS